MRSRRRRRGLLATVLTLALTVGVVMVLRRGDPAAPAAVAAGHQHGEGPDPLTAAVLTLNVLVLLGLAVLARWWPPGVRGTDRTRPTWRYRERDPDAPADDRPTNPS